MENYNEKMRIQLNELDKLISKSNKNLSKLQNVPDDKIRVGKSNGNFQYYRVDKKTNKIIYIKKASQETLRKILQRNYEMEVNKKLKILRKRLYEFLRLYDIDEIEKVYTNQILSPLVTEFGWSNQWMIC